MQRTLRGRMSLMLGAASMATLLLVAAACAGAEEPAATPRPVAPVATVAPGAPTPVPAPATAIPAPKVVGLTQWLIGTAEDPTVKPTSLTVGGAVGPGRVHAEIYTTMLRREGKDSRMVPEAASSWEYVNNNNSLVFHLKKGIMSHKGTELTSADFKYTWDISRGNPKLGAASVFRYVDSVDAPDPYTIRINFSKLDVTFLAYNVAVQRAVPKERGAPDSMAAEAFDKKPFGHGPYKAIRYERDKPIELEVFTDYFGGVSTPAKMKIIWMRDGATRVAALLAGEAHLVESLSLAQAPVVRANRDLAITTSKGVRGVYWQFNMRDKPMADLKVRQALNYAMNKEVVVNDLLEGFGVIQAAPLVRGWLGYLESIDLKPYPYDPAKAVRLLEEAGYPRGFEFDFSTSSGVFQKDLEIAEAYASMWEGIGLKPRLRATERGTIFAIFRDGDDWDIAGTFQWGVSIEPDGYLRWLIGDYSKVLKESTVLEPARALKEKARGILDPVERGKVYGELNRFMHEMAVLPFSHAQDELYGVNRATGWVPFPIRGSQAESTYRNQAKLVGYGPNYEKWGPNSALPYYNR